MGTAKVAVAAVAVVVAEVALQPEIERHVGLA